MKSSLFFLVLLLASSGCSPSNQRQEVAELTPVSIKLINNDPDVKGVQVGDVYVLSVRGWGFGAPTWHMDEALEKFGTASKELSEQGLSLLPESVKKDSFMGNTGGHYVWITASFIKSNLKS